MKNDAAVAARQAAHDRLDQLLDQFAAVEKADGVVRRIGGMVLLADAAAFAGSLSGPETMASVYGAGDSRANGLEALSHRIAVAAFLFAPKGGGDGYDLGAAAAELRAISQGDAPRLFAQLSPRVVKARIQEAQWRAREWEAFMEGLGFSTSDRRRRVEEAFLRHPWDTISRWKPPANGGSAGIMLQDARNAGRDVSAGRTPRNARWLFGRTDNWEANLIADGKLLQKEQRQRKTGS